MTNLEILKSLTIKDKTFIFKGKLNRLVIEVYQNDKMIDKRLVNSKFNVSRLCSSDALDLLKVVKL